MLAEHLLRFSNHKIIDEKNHPKIEMVFSCVIKHNPIYEKTIHLIDDAFFFLLQFAFRFILSLRKRTGHAIRGRFLRAIKHIPYL